MSWWVWVILAVALILVVLIFRLSNKAGRLDRLHRRVDAASVSLNNALLRRTSVVSEFGATMLPDPVSAAVLTDAAHEARAAADADPVSRGLAESNLTRVLGATFDDPELVPELIGVLGDDELTDELSSASRRVEMSRRFQNDAVRACRAVRQQRLVRWFRLAGHTPMPQPFEMDDSVPVGFGIR